MDWPDIGEMTDDFYHIVPDGISPDFREKRKDLRERFAELSAEGKKKVLRRIGEEAEESEDHTVEEFFRQHIRGYSQSEY